MFEILRTRVERKSGILYSAVFFCIIQEINNALFNKPSQTEAPEILCTR